VTRLQQSRSCLRSRFQGITLPHSRVRRVRLLPLFPVLIQLLWGATFLHGQVLGTISTFAGQCNSTGFAGDGGLATAAKLGNKLGDLAIDPDGNVYVADEQQNRVRRIDTTGIITTVAGAGGGNGFAGDGGPATASTVKVSSPNGIAVNPNTSPPPSTSPITAIAGFARSLLAGISTQWLAAAPPPA
jgi:hypothetical protein